MFSRKQLVIVAIFAFAVANVIALFLSARYVSPSSVSRHPGMEIVAPLQKAVTVSIQGMRSIWLHYFFLVSAEKENDRLKKQLGNTLYDANQCRETELANERFRRLLDFKTASRLDSVAAEVIGKDPSQWFKTLTIDKGVSEGIAKGMPVVVPEGVVGQVIDVVDHYAKVLLIIDSNSAVDALVQQSRVHGIIKGKSEDTCVLSYVSRKETVHVGDAVVSSGLDSVYPKGLLIGKVTDVGRNNAGIFQDVEVSPYVAFDKIEEVLVILSLPPQSRAR